jgi:hypothetical protein
MCEYVGSWGGKSVNKIGKAEIGSLLWASIVCE